MIKYIDEFGRQREAPKSEVPSEFLPKPSFISRDDSDSDEYVVPSPYSCNVLLTLSCSGEYVGMLIYSCSL